jgi:hypothetical protein
MPRPSRSPTETIAESFGLPDVLFVEDLARVLRTSRATIDRLRRYKSFPIPELPAVVQRFINGEDVSARRRKDRRT